jgi:hypothetical protein
MSAISHYRGGTIDVVAPVAKKLKAAYLKHGIVYRLSRFETGPNRGDWLVVVQYDQAAHETLQAAIAQDAECQEARRDCKVREQNEPGASPRSRSLTGLECVLLARNRHADCSARCPLSGTKRKTYPRSELFRFGTRSGHRPAAQDLRLISEVC